MPRTKVEQAIIQQRRTQGVIRPLLEQAFQFNIGIETEEDARWLYQLAQKQVEREAIRKGGDGVYSPSGLASCMRRVYLGKNWKKLGLERVELPSVDAHYYFATGDFIHLKWQFALYKLSMMHPDFWLLDVEVPILSKRKDHGGTIDAVCLFDGEVLPIDFKGLNVRAFGKIARGEVPHEYRIQLTDYAMLLNSNPAWWKQAAKVAKALGAEIEVPKVKRAILLAESKGGPDAYHPLALHEAEINVKDNLPDVRARLGVLREHEANQEIPAPECVSTRGYQFQGCPFAEFCRKEVKAIQKRRDAADRSDSAEFSVAVPSRRRANRSRRARSKS